MPASPERVVAIHARYGNMAMHFERNAGQADPAVRYLARGRGYTLLLTDTGAVLKLASAAQGDGVVRMRLANSNRAARIRGEGDLPGRVNYLTGRDASKWRTNVPTVSRVRYEEVYPGIDLVYYGTGRQLEFDYVIAPGADPSRICMAFGGIDGQTISPDGSLVLRIPRGQLVQRKPFIYQEREGHREVVAGRYRLDATGTVGFELGSYDATRPLVIDPILEYGTWLGGTHSDSGAAIAVDSAGAAYVTGSTSSAAIPGAGGPAPGGASDAFVTKVAPDGASFLYTTFIGGNGQDEGRAIAVDAAGRAYVGGTTYSPDFPTASTDFSSPSGSAFVCALNASGSVLVYSARIAGYVNGIAVTPDGTLVAAGLAGASSIPIRAGFQSNLTSSSSVGAFILRVGPSGSLLNGSYLGGNGTDIANAVVLDGAGRAYIVGDTTSSDFPVTADAAQVTIAGGGLSRSANGGHTFSHAAGMKGDVRGFARDPGSGTLLALTASGLYSSVDGEYWAMLNNADAAAVAVSATGVVYEALNSGSILVGSLTAPATWTTPASLPAGVNAGAVATVPGSGTEAYASISNALYKTTDSGATWNRVDDDSLPANSRIASIAIVPESPSTILVSLRDYGLSAVYRSFDGGRSWTASSSGLPAPNGWSSRPLLVDASATPSLLYFNALDGGVFRSIDGGNSWAPVTLPAGVSYWAYAAALTVSDTGALFKAFGSALYTSTDGGANWTRLGEPDPSDYSNTAAFAHGSTVLLGSAQAEDIFLARVDFGATSSSIGYATFLGGPSRDIGRAVALDRDGNSLVAGYTLGSNSNFPAVGAPLGTCAGQLARIDAATGALTRSTALPLTGVGGLAVDANGNVFVGAYYEPNPALNPLPDVMGGGGVMKIDPTLSAVRYATVLPNYPNSGKAIAVDLAGSLYATGSAAIGFTPVNAAQATFGGAYDAYVLKITTRPEVASVSPAIGNTIGGTVVALAGTNFVQGMSVRFGANAATAVTVTSQTSATATVPPGLAGTVDVVVTNLDDESATLSNGFEYRPGPELSGLLPDRGSIAGGTVVTITGIRLADVQAVLFGGVAASFSVDSDTTIIATTPARGSAEAVDVVVVANNGTSAARTQAFTYLLPAPVITSVTPSSGTAGTVIAIAGSGFNDPFLTVTVGGIVAPPTVLSDTSLRVTVPYRSTPGFVDVSVTNSYGTATRVGGFTYNAPAPVLSYVSPSFGEMGGGTVVTIGGSNFVDGAKVTFGGIESPSVIYVAPVSLRATTPSGVLGPVTVRVTNPDGQIAERPAAFSYLDVVPSIDSVAPISGPDTGGTQVTITGTGFKPGATVRFAGITASSVVVVSDTGITAVTPPSFNTGAVAVSVTNSDGGSATRPFAFTFVGPPAASSVSPTHGPVGTLVTVFGRNFATDVAATLGGMAATVSRESAGKIVLAVPAGLPDGPASLTLTNVVDGTTVTCAWCFTVGSAALPVGAFGAVERVNVKYDGGQLTTYDLPFVPSVSQDGRYMLFTSSANGVVVGDANNQADLFVRDRQSHQTFQVNLKDGGGATANPFYSVGSASVSSTGQFAVFTSTATDLVPGDTNGGGDVFVRDVLGGTTRRVSMTDLGQGPAFTSFSGTSISDDGRFVAFATASPFVAGDTNGVLDIFVRDRDATGSGEFDSPAPGATSTIRASVALDGTEPNGASTYPILTPDGRFVAFQSSASNLVAGDTNGVSDIFVRDRRNVSTARVSVASDGTQANRACSSPSISADGRFVVFTSAATNLVSGKTTTTMDVFLHDRDVSGSGTFDAPGNTSTTRVSVSASGAEAGGNTSVIAGRAISPDGRYVVFSSSAANLVPFDGNAASDVFRFDRLTGDLLLVSTRADGSRTDSMMTLSPDSSMPAIVGDGSLVFFASQAANLVDGDTNELSDIFAKVVSPNTPAGSAVEVTPVDPHSGQQPVTLTFSTVSGGGTTTVTASSSGPAGPSDFEVVGSYYEITTTAGYTPPVRVCLAHPMPLPGNLTPGDLVLRHFENGSWVTLTTTVDSARQTVCGDANSLSPFALFARSAASDATPPVLSNVPANQTMEAAGPAGTTVSWSAPTAMDAVSGNVAVACTPASGSTFPLGTTTVSCSANDAAGNHAEATFAVTVRDTSAPTINIAAPAAGSVALNRVLTAGYSCADAGSGIASCRGTTSDGSHIDTSSVGTKTFTVTAIDRAGNVASATVEYRVGYELALLYDHTKAKRIGSIYPIKIGLRDAAGLNVSSPNVLVTALGFSLTSETALGPIEDSGNANPDGNFRYADGGYVFNLSTKGLATGAYLVYFRCGGDPAVHSAPFQVR